MSLCDKSFRERLRTERPHLHTEFNVDRLISCKEDANCMTVVVELGELCPLEKKVELAGYKKERRETPRSEPQRNQTDSQFIDSGNSYADRILEVSGGDAKSRLMTCLGLVMSSSSNGQPQYEDA